MNFAPPRSRRRSAENIVPMINVVFLLLIFFLMSAQITPPDPLDITLARSTTTDTNPEPDTLFVAADGQLAYDGALGDNALTLIAMRAQKGPLTIRADAALPATELAALLKKLGAAGVSQTVLQTGGQ